MLPAPFRVVLDANVLHSNLEPRSSLAQESRITWWPQPMQA